MYQLTLKPLDVLFFGKKSFSLGEFGETNLLPYPHTMAGAITALLKELGVNGDYPLKAIYGPFLYHQRLGYLFFKPLDLVSERKTGEGIYRLRLEERGELIDLIHTNVPEGISMLPFYMGAEAVEVSEGFITLEGLLSYLNGENVDREHVLRFSDVLLLEERIGIKRERDTRTTEEDGLYRLRVLRLPPEVQIAVWFEMREERINVNDLKMKVFTLGGERRAVKVIDAREDDFRALFKGVKPPKGRLKILFLTHGYFKGKWRPKRYSLFSACVKGGTVSMRSKEGEVKRVKVIQPGSVFWLEESLEELIDSPIGFLGLERRGDYIPFIGSNLVVMVRW